jgi:hypothetical protein
VKSETKKTAMLQISSAAIVLIAAIAIYVFYHNRPLDKERLKVLVGDLRSTASEANLLTDQIAQEKVKPTYTDQHLSMMIEAAKKTSDKLKKSKVQDDLAPEKEITVKTAQQLVTSLEKYRKESVITEDFENLERKLDQVEESLE